MILPVTNQHQKESWNYNDTAPPRPQNEQAQTETVKSHIALINAFLREHHFPIVSIDGPAALEVTEATTAAIASREKSMRKFKIDCSSVGVNIDDAA